MNKEYLFENLYENAPIEFIAELSSIDVEYLEEIGEKELRSIIKGIVNNLNEEQEKELCEMFE